MFDVVIRSLRQTASFGSVVVLAESNTGNVKAPWFPKHASELNNCYKYGDPIPHINYTETENKTWSAVFARIKEVIQKHACSEYVAVPRGGEDFRERAHPAAAGDERLPSQEHRVHTASRDQFVDFFASLAFRFFQSMQ